MLILIENEEAQYFDMNKMIYIRTQRKSLKENSQNRLLGRLETFTYYVSIVLLNNLT